MGAGECEAEQLSAIEESIDSGLVTDENKIREFEERKNEFLQRLSETFSRGF